MIQGSFTMKYSPETSRRMVIVFVLPTLLFIPVGLARILNLIPGSGLVSMIIFVLIVTFILQLSFVLPSYFRHRKDFMCRQLVVDGNDIVASNGENNPVLRFSPEDIVRYFFTIYSFSTYQAIILELSEGRKVIVSNTMTNFDQLQRLLKSVPGLKRKRKSVSVAAHLTDSLS